MILYTIAHDFDIFRKNLNLTLIKKNAITIFVFLIGMSTTNENFVLHFQDFLSEILAILDNNSNFCQHFYKIIILVVIK